MTSSLKIRKTRNDPWTTVDNRVFYDLRLSLEARAVLGWMLGRSDGFEIRIGPLCRMLGVSDTKWRRIRGELTAAGYFVQAKRPGAGGRFVWENEVTDYPLDRVPSPFHTIPLKSTDGYSKSGETSHGSSMAGSAKHGENTNNNNDVNDSDVNKNNNKEDNNNGSHTIVSFSDGTSLGDIPNDWADEIKAETEHRCPPSIAKSRYATGILREWRRAGKPTLSRIQPAAPAVTKPLSTQTARCPPPKAFLQQVAKLKQRKAASRREAG